MPHEENPVLVTRRLEREPLPVPEFVGSGFRCLSGYLAAGVTCLLGDRSPTLRRSPGPLLGAGPRASALVPRSMAQAPEAPGQPDVFR